VLVFGRLLDCTVGPSSHRQDHTELGVAAHHARVSLGRSFERIAFNHGTHAAQFSEAQGILGIGGCSRGPALPFGPRPSISSDIAFELGAVATITWAPPSFCNSSAAFVALLSIYTAVPSFFANASFLAPRPMAATL
jgi:hypothetical protein